MRSIIAPVALILCAVGCSSRAPDAGFQNNAVTGGNGAEEPKPTPSSPTPVADAGANQGAGDDAGGDDTSPADAAPPVPACASTSVTISVVDYFSGSPVTGVSATVDGAASTGTTLCLGPGVHPVSLSAAGYATYNGAVQLPGGSTARTVTLFPVTASMTAWVSLTNSDRQSNGAPPVALDNGLTIAAWDHAIDMGVQGYFAHFDPIGLAPTTRSLLLGSMVMGSENIAAGYMNYEAADAVFMGEKAMLPNQSPSDCATDDSAAGHYCNIVAASHNWMGLAIADVPGSPDGTYFDEEFGDLYGYYDTTVVPALPALGTSASLTMVPASGQTFQYEFLETLPTPTPIPVATLNADPLCSSMCPAADQWYPTGNVQVSTSGPVPYSPPLTQNQIVFPALETNANPFVGASAYAAFWAGGTTAPTTYGASSQTYQVQ